MPCRSTALWSQEVEAVASLLRALLPSCCSLAGQGLVLPKHRARATVGVSALSGCGHNGFESFGGAAGEITFEKQQRRLTSSGSCRN